VSGPTTRKPVESTTETDLVGRARAGDVWAFERLVSAHTDRLFVVVLRLVGDRGEAEDVVQETLLRAWRGLARFQGRSLFFTWLYRIAVNEAHRAMRMRSRVGRGVDVDQERALLLAPASEEPANQAEQHELHRALNGAIADLEPSYRTAFVLRDIDGLSTRVAAEMAGVGEAAFKSRLRQARLKIRASVGASALVASVS
jgi:RNA polymerase sigma-70 factor (ECF subfamily)